MTEYKKIFVDTSPFIYYLENNTTYVKSLKEFFDHCINKNIMLITSTITIEEYLVYPFKINNNLMIDNFLTFLSVLRAKVLNIDSKIAINAARLRSKYEKIKAMDALQISACEIEECDLFLTNDNQLKKIREINCKLVSEL